jgi:hypothetical protein
MSSDISRIQNIELQEAIHFKDWIGWKVGWLTGWYNPIDRLGDLVNPAELGRLITIQGEFMQSQGKLVQELGGKLTEFARGARAQTPTPTPPAKG